MMAVVHSFYVAECQKWVSGVREVNVLAEVLSRLINKVRPRLTQWLSTSQDVLDPIPTSDRTKNVKAVDLSWDGLPPERAVVGLKTVETYALVSMSTSQKILLLDEVFLQLFHRFTAPWNGSSNCFEQEYDCIWCMTFEVGLRWVFSWWCQHNMAADFAIFEIFCDPKMFCAGGFQSVVFGGPTSFRWYVWVWLHMRSSLVLGKSTWLGPLYLCLWQVTYCFTEAKLIVFFNRWPL